MHVLLASYIVVDWEPADVKHTHVPQVDTPRSLAHALKKWPTVCMAVYTMRGMLNLCNIAVSEKTFFDPHCPLSTGQRFQDEQTLQR